MLLRPLCLSLAGGTLPDLSVSLLLSIPLSPWSVKAGDAFWSRGPLEVASHRPACHCCLTLALQESVGFLYLC